MLRAASSSSLSIIRSSSSSFSAILNPLSAFLTSNRLISSLSSSSSSSSSLSSRIPLRSSHFPSLPISSLSSSFSLSSPLLFYRFFSSVSASPSGIENIRNIGISAHIDSGKTTLTERILYYTGRINEIHEVKGKDGVGATMDFMELEREKGITIQSAATYAQWKTNNINIIDTPGHVDFTIEVERALRVLDGAIMVLCGVAGVQSQSMTVDRQMKRYSVPRLVFINKLDRMGANPYKPLSDLRTTLGHNAALMQIPIGSESNFTGIVDLITGEAIVFEGNKGETMKKIDIPEDLKELYKEKRQELIERVSEVDDELAEIFLNGSEPTIPQLKAAIRRSTIALKFVPVFMGTAMKNKGIQTLLDAVIDYLPNPLQKKNYALNQNKNEEKIELINDPKLPFVGLAFKLEERPFGQLTYMRVYQGKVKKGDSIYDVKAGKKVRIPRIVRMHANSMEDITEGSAGEIVAMFGVDCPSGSTFTENLNYTMTSMHVPDPVISLAIKPKTSASLPSFSKALGRFQREDPTFRVHMDDISNETIISGMGELHLDIYIERMKREYGVDCITGQPKVNYRETPSRRADFNYLHKKQSGGAGQFGRVIGYLEPLDNEEDIAKGKIWEYRNELVGMNVPPELQGSIEKGFKEAIEKGLAGFPVVGVRIVVTDGQSHSVDSNDVAFRAAARGAFRQAFPLAAPQILEPIMSLEVDVPAEFQGPVVASLNRRKGLILDVEHNQQGSNRCIIKAEIPLVKMFGYSTDLRSATEGKGEFSMEYLQHRPVTKDDQAMIMKEAEKNNANKSNDD